MMPAVPLFLALYLVCIHNVFLQKVCAYIFLHTSEYLSRLLSDFSFEYSRETLACIPKYAVFRNFACRDNSVMESFKGLARQHISVP